MPDNPQEDSALLVKIVGGVAALASTVTGLWFTFRGKKVDAELTEKQANLAERSATFEKQQNYIVRMEKLAEKFEAKSEKLETKLGECLAVCGLLRQELQEAKWEIARLKEQVTALSRKPNNGS